MSGSGGDGRISHPMQHTDRGLRDQDEADQDQTSWKEKRPPKVGLGVEMTKIGFTSNGRAAESDPCTHGRQRAGVAYKGDDGRRGGSSTAQLLAFRGQTVTTAVHLNQTPPVPHLINITLPFSRFVIRSTGRGRVSAGKARPHASIELSQFRTIIAFIMLSFMLPCLSMVSGVLVHVLSGAATYVPSQLLL